MSLSAAIHDSNFLGLTNNYIPIKLACKKIKGNDFIIRHTLEKVKLRSAKSFVTPQVSNAT